MKQRMMDIFPDMEEEWNLDGGETFIEEFFRVHKMQQYLKKQWQAIKDNPNISPFVTIWDLSVIAIRLLPYHVDSRQPMPAEVEKAMLDMLDVNQSKKMILPREQYVNLMVFLQLFKINDEINQILMRRRILARQLNDSMKEEEHQKFEVRVETGELMEAELLATLEIDGQDYAVYTLPGEGENVDILASRIVQDEKGFDVLEDLKDPLENEKIRNLLESVGLYEAEPL